MRLTIIHCLFHIVLSLLVCTQAGATDLTDVSIFGRAEQTQLRLTTTSNAPPKVFFLSEGNPRIVIDMESTGLIAIPNSDNSRFSGRGSIKQVRYAVRAGKDLRLVADLTKHARYSSHSFKNGTLTINVTGQPQSRVFTGIPHPRLKNGLAMPEPVNVASETVTDVDNIPVPRLKNGLVVVRSHKPIIVIDPGHGGYDPGAIGTAKTKEETVTLSAALELRKQLLKTGKYKVVLTRDADVYVKHEKRVRIARTAGADLFISLHADSIGKPATRGASVYTLAARAHGRGQRLVNTQNWILDVDLATKSAPVSDILVDLAQRKTLSRSSQFADILVPELRKKTKLLGNTHREAGLYVLLAPDVPAVLLEMGFLSNAKDEKLLNSAAHRKKLMKGVTSAINVYFKSQTTLQASR